MDSSVSDYNISCTVHVFLDILQEKKNTDYFSSSFGSINKKIILIVIAVGFKQLHSHSKIKVLFTTGDHQSLQLIYSFPEFKYTLPFSMHNHFDEWS